jgi:hypothetical protein
MTNEKEIIYPKPGDTLIDQTQTKILFTNWYASDWQAFPFAYKAAADALVDRLEADRGNHTMVPDDRFVFPILFLYRHFVELQLKSLIGQLDHFTQQPIKKFNIHILPTLWNHIKDNLHHLSHSEVNLNDIGDLDSLITELSSLDEKSTNFRYPEESPSQPPRLPRSLSMDNLKSVMTAIGNALTLVESAIDSEKAYWYAQDENWDEEEESTIPWNNFTFY